MASERKAPLFQQHNSLARSLALVLALLSGLRAHSVVRAAAAAREGAILSADTLFEEANASLQAKEIGQALALALALGRC
jgi:hypothetical protein